MNIQENIHGGDTVDWFYFLQDAQIHGPMSLVDVCHRAEKGALRSDALVCRAGEEQWSRIPEHVFLCRALSDSLARHEHKRALLQILKAVMKTVSINRDLAIQRLNEIKVFYRNAPQQLAPAGRDSLEFFQSTEEKVGPCTLWQVLDGIDAETLPVEVQVCILGTDFWRDALKVCATRLGMTC